MFNPKVSIVIPVYKGSNYLREAIDSALAQTYKNIEVIVVNDGSNDGGKTEAIAKSYGDRIRYFYKENGGVATALNLGIRKMTGEYFSWLSHDDVYYPNKIEVQIDYLRKDRKDVVLYSDNDFIDHSSKKIRTRRVKHIEPEKFIFSLLDGHLVHGCTVLVPKVCFDVVGLFNEDLKSTQDYEMWFRLGRKYKVVHIPEVLIQARLHTEQTSVIMDAVHSNERNNLFIWYFKEVSSETTDNFLPSYLLRTAIHLRTLGFFEASKYGYDLAMEKISNNNWLWIRNLFLIVSYLIRTTIRPFIIKLRLNHPRVYDISRKFYEKIKSN